jgi:hypothetical protein
MTFASIFRGEKCAERGESGMDIIRSTNTGSLSKAVGVVRWMLKELLLWLGRLGEIISLSELVEHTEKYGTQGWNKMITIYILLKGWKKN